MHSKEGSEVHSKEGSSSAKLKAVWRLEQHQCAALVLRCLGDPLESPIDISCILNRSEFLGMPYLPVINLVIKF